MQRRSDKQFSQSRLSWTVLAIIGMVSLPHAAHIGVYLSTIENTAQNDCERGDPAYDTKIASMMPRRAILFTHTLVA